MKPKLGPGWLEPFHSSPYSLRFELGGGYDNIAEPVPRFLQAFGRAKVVADELFEFAETIGVIGTWKLGKRDLFIGKLEPGTTGISMLKGAGFSAGDAIATWKERPYWVGPDEGFNFDWHAYDLSNAKAAREVILWCNITYEMPIQPKVPLIGYLYSPGKDVVMHVYDDRGMDVIGLSVAALEGVCRRFDDWLLDYDRPRMRESFGSLVSEAVEQSP
jgi:hypothetical protein